MKEKLKFLGIASIVVLAAMGFYLWGLNGSQTGTGLEIITKRLIMKGDLMS